MWVLSIVGSIVIADRKNLNVLFFFFLSIFLGPIALIIAAASTAKPKSTSNHIPTEPLTAHQAREQLKGIKTTLHLLNQRIERIESVLGPEPSEQVVEPNSASINPEPTVKPLIRESSKSDQTTETMEFVFGKYWLNRIGVVLFVIGIGLFINHTFHYFSSWFKIAIGYLFAVLFLVWGEQMHKNPRYQKLSWGILGGAWGLFYLVTYAMYYVPATKVISNSYVELALLWVVTAFAIQYNLKYRSWIATAMSYWLGFITLSLGSLDITSVIFWLMLIGSLAFLSYVFVWDELIVAGILGAYCVYQIVLVNKVGHHFSGHYPINDFQLLMSFLGGAWMIYFCVLLAKQLKTAEVSKILLKAMAINTIFFAFFVLKEMESYQSNNVELPFLFLLALSSCHLLAAVLCRYFQRPKYIVGYCGLAITLASMAILIKYQNINVIFWWIAQSVMMFALGVYYRELIYRVMFWLLGVGVLLHFYWVDLSSTVVYNFGFFKVGHDCLTAFLIAGISLVLGITVHLLLIKDALSKDERNIYLAMFPVIGAAILLTWMADNSPARWLTLHWSLLGLMLLGGGFLLQYRALRLTALGLLCVACGRILVYELAGVDTIYKIIVVIFLGAAFLGVSFLYSKSFLSKPQDKEKA